MKPLIYLSLILCAAFAVTLTNLAPYVANSQALKLGNSTIVRLHDTKTGKFFCSGVVVSDKLIATAYHCVDRSDMFSAKLAPSVNVRLRDSKDLRVIAKVVGGNPRADVAMITGDFSKFTKASLVSDVSTNINALVNNKIPLIACGYPWGDDLNCATITARAFYNFGILAEGMLFPGMSGGPVFRVDTGEVVALNSAVSGGKVFLVPTMSIYINSNAEQYHAK